MTRVLINQMLICVLLLCLGSVTAQADRWQQHVLYDMDIDFDVKNHQFTGDQEVVYTNNSPETLNRFFYHLYFNAFQPGSMMDVRSRTIMDPSPKIMDRIAKLAESEIGYHKILSLTQDGMPCTFEVVGTVLEVVLPKPIAPGSSSIFKMKFEGQVPVQIRRSGRDNAEGIDYSMAQWYPKVCEYDYQGWHANPYIGREFYGVWGDFDVRINIDEDYTVAASGILQNADEIGRGYTDVRKPKTMNGKINWHFKAENVHDFLWAADRDYVIEKKKMHDGTLVYFAYQPGERTTDNWNVLPDIMDEALKYINEHFGQYSYPVYSFIQGGDGGMEYPMATLITGERSIGSLVGVSVHEWMHSWYQMMLGTNESLYSWMDEGFTSFASGEVMNHLREKKLIPGDVVEDPHLRSVQGYIRFNKGGLDQPLTTHSDHFKTNQAYGVAAYTKGAVCLSQLEYILGYDTFRKALLKYFDTWKYKHPSDNDFFRIMELESGLELDWFKEYFVYSTDLPDYAVGDVITDGDGNTEIQLFKLAQMPMPQEVSVTFVDGTEKIYYIPIRLMRGEKNTDEEIQLLEDWPWTHPNYNILIEGDKVVQSVVIDKTGRMLDGNRENNTWSRSDD